MLQWGFGGLPKEPGFTATFPSEFHLFFLTKLSKSWRGHFLAIVSELLDMVSRKSHGEPERIVQGSAVAPFVEFIMMNLG